MLIITKTGDRDKENVSGVKDIQKNPMIILGINLGGKNGQSKFNILQGIPWNDGLAFVHGSIRDRPFAVEYKKGIAKHAIPL
jgi:hypothetical protein